MSEAASFQAVPHAQAVTHESDVLLTLNAGSSSVKFALFDAQELSLRLDGEFDGLGAELGFKVRDAEGALLVDQRWTPAETQPADHAQALAWTTGWLSEHRPRLRVVAVGHRVVHGGAHFSAPALIDDGVLAALHDLIPLAPLHQPHNLAGIAAAHASFGDVPQVACFDTAFHRGMGFDEEAFALPLSYHAEGIRRYGFHGLSYEYVARQLRTLDPGEALGRVVVAHLGNGASLCAMRQGRSIAATVGFSALDGLPMGTRCGRIDPGVLLYLLEQRQMTPADLSTLLYQQSGMRGLSGGLSHDMRTLEAAGTPAAEQAIGYFVAAIRREIGMLAATLQGLDALVFTGGIGTHSQRVRREVMQGLGWLGVAPDNVLNEDQGDRVSAPGSRVLCLRMATDEESMIARHTARAARLRPALHLA